MGVRVVSPGSPMMSPPSAAPVDAGAAMPQGDYSTAAPSFADDATPGAYSVEAEMAASEVERSGAAQVFRMPGGTDVPSDGRPHTLGLAEDDLPCRFEYVAMPAVAPGAHLRALAANRTGRVLLAGDLHVFHAGAAGGEYVGAPTPDLTAPDRPLQLYPGVDDN